jgi:hypothetical protein
MNKQVLIATLCSITLFSVSAQEGSAGTKGKFLKVHEFSQEEQDMNKVMNDAMALIEKYRETKNPQDLATAKSKLLIYNKYNVEKHKKRLPDMEKRIQEENAKLAEEEKGIPAKVEARFKEIEAIGNPKKVNASQLQMLFVRELSGIDPVTVDELNKMMRKSMQGGMDSDEYNKRVKEEKAKAKANFEKEMAELKVLVDKYRDGKKEADTLAVKAKLTKYAQRDTEKQRLAVAQRVKELEEAKKMIAEEETGAPVEAMLKAVVAGDFPASRSKGAKGKASDNKEKQ